MNHQLDLETKGYTIFHETLRYPEAAYARRMFKDWYEKSEINYVPQDGHVKYWQAGHNDCAWYIRTREKVQQPFRKLYNCEDIKVSYEGQCYVPENHKRRKDRYRGHIDQTQPGFMGYQGLVSLTTNSKCTFACIPGSHLKHDEILESTGGQSTRQYRKVPGSLEDLTKIRLGTGDLLVWDSRLVHQNIVDTSEERLVQYVSFRPASMLTRYAYNKRRQCYDERRTTTHWAYPMRVYRLQHPSKNIDYENLCKQQREKWYGRNMHEIS